MEEQENRPILKANTASGMNIDRKRALLDKYVSTQLARDVSHPRGSAPGLPERPTPLSFNQQQIWLHSQMSSDVPFYNEAITIYRQGPLDVMCWSDAY